ncbi:Glycine/D-amino acid oxidase [Saccharopolyspora antimicrobica]|uniref:Glycine/D-amino acid oxidase n=1 Tax=Saccharopolyspora antimicrobica TaxID=455193 RepID=A0A1I5H2L0_9PSEU|nr:FAD-dependent oxidoreductase [Saccharopolyspora antimicrobica]RKT90101.1 glycine/D-amino acid oxidase-like deaminating enzyme [Saccharopolyspora antimicrobica]SFO42465.1 Glycine/D-amino acid oxidase [Saccharopolyspora antimicrobica]
MAQFPDIVVVGAGIVGAACAEALSSAGLVVQVLDRHAPAAGTSAAGEGNVLVSDKPPGAELRLALASRERWPELVDDLREELGGAADFEWEAKGGVVAATTVDDAVALEKFAAEQRAAGVDARILAPGEALQLEPHLTRETALAVHYPQDAQVQPVLAASALLAAVRKRGGAVRKATASGVTRGADGRVTGVRTDRGVLPCGAVVNACGPWSAEFARACGAPIAIHPRRGVALVTAPVPVGTVRHKVYDADYVGAVESGDADLQTSTVVESTRAGTVLIGSSRERIGFDDTIRTHVLREIARKAAALFPVLGRVPVMRAYGGFRPYAPDHLPVIGEDPRVPGLWHATGHEGAGVGLAAATGRLLADLVTGRAPQVDPVPFRVDRPALLEEVPSSAQPHLRGP